METAVTIIFGVIGVAIVVAAVGITFYKSKHNTKANLQPRKEKEF